MKVNINKLPQGFDIVDGKVIESKSHGGMHTGDQYNYHLVTNTDTHWHNGNGDIEGGRKVNTSIQPVPREEANIEAEKGETVLTDMNDDGVFELYNIAGKRHSRGGTPLDLPPQSFIYSDTREMKLNKAELNELGIDFKKKLTPATVSKKYQLNKYLEILDNPHSDNIAIDTAEYMLDKNKKKLSHLAFVQEAKKDFVEGVPLASYAYLKEQGLDPEQYAAKIDTLNQQEIQLEADLQMPPSLQEAALNLNSMLSDINQAEQGLPPEAMQQPAQTPPGELPMAQPLSPEQMAQAMPMPQEAPMAMQQPGMPQEQVPIPEFDTGGDFAGLNEDQQNKMKQAGYTWNGSRWVHPTGTDANTDFIINQLKKGYNIDLVEDYDQPGIGVDGQQSVDYMTNIPKDLFMEQNKTILSGVKDADGNPMFTDDNPYDPSNKDHVKAYQTEHRKFTDNYYKTNPKVQEMYPNIEDYYRATGTFWDNPDNNWSSIDGHHGEYTNRSRAWTLPEEKKIDVEIKNTDTCPDAEKKAAECKEKGLTWVQENCGCGAAPPATKTTTEWETPEFWLQDQIKLTDLYQKKLNQKKYMPWAQTVAPVQVDATYVDPTQAIQSIQASAKEAGDNTVFAGKAANMAAKMKAQGMAMKEAGNIFARTQEANMQENQQVRKMNSYMKAEAAQKNAAIKTKLYDDVQRVHADYDNTKSKLNTQIANQLANAYTNMSNTENLNTLYPQFDIDQGSGGFIRFENPQDLFPKQTDDESATDKFIRTTQDLQKVGIDVNNMDGSTLELLAGISEADKEKEEKNKNPYAEVSPFVEAMANSGYTSKYGTEKRNRIKMNGAALRQWFSPLQKGWAD
tara:strand:- start:259 stop:2802 length:2544 start_codon:yes stop_codon:yes gene_type:complete